MNIKNYDKYIVYFSGGKDSMACLLYLLDTGIPIEKIELWHHDIDVNHPAYHLGCGRVSCKYCIFGSADQFASAYYVSPKECDEIITLELR